MELANVQVALGGHKGNTVRKYGVTPAEVVVLQRLHGLESVFDLEPLAESVERSKREERSRLIESYSRPEGDRMVSVVTELYPNHITIEDQFAELDLMSTAYMAVERLKPAPIVKEKLGQGRTAQRKEKSGPKADESLLDDDDDDAGDMPRTGNALA